MVCRVPCGELRCQDPEWCLFGDGRGGARHHCQEPDSSELTIGDRVLGGMLAVIGGQHGFTAGEEEYAECERMRTKPQDFMVKYWSWTLKANTPSGVRELLAGKHNRIQHGCSPHSLRHRVACLHRELHRHPDVPQGDNIKTMMTKTAYTAQDGTCNGIQKRWFPLAKLLAQGSDAVVQVVAKLQGKKAEPKFEDFVCVQGLHTPEVSRIVALITSDGFSVQGMRHEAKRLKAIRLYDWHLVNPENPHVHSSRSM